MKWSYSLSLFSGTFTVGLCSIIIYAGSYLKDMSVWAIVLAVVCFFLMLLTLLIIGRQPTSSVKLSFKVRHPSAFRISVWESLNLLTFLSVSHCVLVCVQRYRDGLELKWGFSSEAIQGLTHTHTHTHACVRAHTLSGTRSIQSTPPYPFWHYILTFHLCLYLTIGLITSGFLINILFFMNNM
jgi:hypothetical protein